MCCSMSLIANRSRGMTVEQDCYTETSRDLEFMHVKGDMK